MEPRTAQLFRLLNTAMTKAYQTQELSTFAIEIPFNDLALDDSGLPDFEGPTLMITIDMSWIDEEGYIEEEYD